MASAFDDLFGGNDYGSQTSNGSAFDSIFQDNYGNTPNETYNAQADYNNESEADLRSAFDDIFKEDKEAQPQYSVQEAAQQANGGQSFAQAALQNVTGEQPEQQKLGLLEKPEIKTTPERDALIEELKKTPYDSSEYAGYATDEMSAAQIQDFSKRNDILDQLRAIDKELGNGEMDYTALDRAGSVFSNANYQIASGLTNAAGTVARGIGEAINAATGGDKGQKVIDFGTGVQNMSDTMSAAAQQDIDRAKNGLSKFGQAGADIATNVIQMGFDAAVGALTGGGSLASMFLRSAGNSMQQARNEGASTAQQLAYGGVSGGIEVFTEKLADGVAGIYGKGAADNITESLIRKLTSSEFGRSALRLLSGAVSEGGEEVISDLLAPYAELIYNNKSFGDTFKGMFSGDTYDSSEVLYDFIIGATIGAIGGGTSVVTGQNAKANAQLREADTIQNNLVQNNGMSDADARKAADILARVAQGESISKKESAFLDSVQAANGLDTSKPSTAAPQAESQATPTTPAQPEQAQQAETPAALAPQTQAQPSTETITQQAQDAATTQGIKPAVQNTVATDADKFFADNPKKSVFTTQHGDANVKVKRNSDGTYTVSMSSVRKDGKGWTSTTEAIGSVNTLEEAAKLVGDTYESKAESLNPPAPSTASLETPTESAQTTNNTPFDWESKSYKGYTLQFQNEFDGDSVYSIVAPDGRKVGTAVESNLPGETTSPDTIMAVVDNDIAKNGATTSPPAPPQNPTQQPAGTSQQPSGENTQQESQESSEAGSDELNSESGEESGEQPATPYIPNVRSTGPAKQKVSQTSTNSEKNAAEQSGNTQKKLYYTTISEYESLSEAIARVNADKDGEMDRLAHKENWTVKDGDTAQLIKNTLDAEFANSETADPELEKAIDILGKLIQEHTTNAAQLVQGRAKWARTGANALIDIYAEINAAENLTAEEKTQLKKDTAKFMTDFDKIRETDADAADKYRKLILEQNNYRKTGTFFNKNFEKLLNRETDVQWLKEYAYRQALNIPADYTQKASLGQQLKTWQVCAQLSRVGTFFRNLFGNLSFGGIDTFAQDAFGYAIDNLVSKKTGRKEVGFDKSWLSKNAREAAVKAFERSVLEVAGDVDMTGEANRWGQGNNRTNKMAGNEVQRAMSRWEQLLGYSLTSSDRFFRGQIETSYTEALMDDYMKKNPNATDEEINQYRAEAEQIAKETADYRLFQNQGKAAGFSKKVHDALNVLSIGGENGEGGFGLGDLLNPYPGVPANLAVKALEYSPANIVKGGIEIVKLLNDANAGKATSGQQMQAVMDIARGMSGVPIIALFTAIAKSGLFKNSDDDDYDVSAEEAAQNLSGVQWNLSATLRRFNGESPEWKDGDNIMKVSWLEPLSAFMGIASMLSESDEDRDLASMTSTFFEGAVQAALDMPVMENIQNAYNTMRYSTADSFLGRVAEGGAQFAGDALGGMIPAPISQTARVTDEYVRDTKGNSKAETAYNAFLNSIPGLRNTLPVKTDNFGNARENEPDMYNRFMNSFIRPGAISTFRETAVQDEIGKLYKETGDVALYPDRNGPKSVKVDGIDYPLTADESRAYHEFVGQKSEEFVQSLVDNKAYKTLTTEQKTQAVKEMYELARGLAKDAYIDANGIKTDTTSEGTKLLGGINKAGTSNDKTALNESNLANYVVYSQAFGDALKGGDYQQVDKLAKWYDGMDKNLQTVLMERNTDLKRIHEYQNIGLGSETYAKIKAAVPDAQDELDANSSTGSLVRLYGVAKADIPERDRLNVLQNLVQGKNGFIGSNAKAALNTLQAYGLSVQQTAQFFDIALHCATYKETGEAKDFKGKLTPENTAYALMQIPGLSDAQRAAAYNSIRAQVSNYYNDWGTYSFASEKKWFNNSKNKAYYGTNITISPNGQNALLASAG